MKKEIKKLFNDEIRTKFDLLIYKVTRNSSKKNIKTSNLMHHYNKEKNKINSLDDIRNMMRNYIPFYAYSRNELNTKIQNERSHQENISFTEITKRIINQALEFIIPKRKLKNNGIFGELFLNMILELENKKTIIYRSLLRQPASNNEIQGPDCLRATYQENHINLIFGQAKLGEINYCKRGLKDDLKKWIEGDYLEKVLGFVSTRSTSEIFNKELAKEINKFFDDFNHEILYNGKNDSHSINKFLKEKKVTLSFPFILTFEQKNFYSKFTKEKIDKLISDFENLIKDEEISKIIFDFSIDLYLVIINDLSLIRNEELLKYE